MSGALLLHAPGQCIKHPLPGTRGLLDIEVARQIATDIRLCSVRVGTCLALRSTSSDKMSNAPWLRSQHNLK